VLEQQAHARQHRRLAGMTDRASLPRKPLVHQQRLARPLARVVHQNIDLEWGLAVDDGRQRRLPVGHVVGLVQLTPRLFERTGHLALDQVGQCQIAQRALAGCTRVGRVGRTARQRLVGVLPLLGQARAQLRAQALARSADGLRVDHHALLRDERLGGQLQRLLLEAGRQRRVGQRARKHVGQRVVEGDRLLHLEGIGRGDQPSHRQPLPGFPAVEGIGIVRGEESELLVAVAVVDDDRRGQVARQRGHRNGRHVHEAEGLGRLGEFQDARARARSRLAFQLQRQVPAGVIEQTDRKRNVEGRLVGLARRRRATLRQCQLVGAVVGVVARAHRHARRAGLRVPAAELAEIAAGGLGHGGEEVVAGDGLAVVPLQIQRQAPVESRAAEQGLQHAHDLRALFVDRCGVEVADLLVRIGPHRMGHGPCVLQELRGPQRAHVLDALDRACPGRLGAGTRLRGVGRHHVGAELLFAKDCQALLQAQLKPVAAGDAVAGPVVEVLVADHRFDVGVVDVGGHLRIGQHVPGVEDVQALVLHGPHVEIVRGDDHEAIQVELESEAPLVPADRALERQHRVLGLVQLPGLDPDLQQHLPSRGGPQLLLPAGKTARHQGKQVARLREGIVPAGVVAAIGQLALGHQIAVGQECGIRLRLSAQRHRVDRHHVGPVGKEGDAPEALGLALREQVGLRGEQAQELAVGSGPDGVPDAQREAVCRWRDRQVLVGEHVGGCRQSVAVALQPQQLEVLAIEHQRPAGAQRITTDLQVGGDQRADRVEVEVELDSLHEKRWRKVIGTIDRDDLIVVHRCDGRRRDPTAKGRREKV